jgi:DNA-binding NarL/FixJ family response regulator
MSPRQLAVVTLLSRGFTNQQIAENLGVTEAAVKARIQLLFKKTGARSRTELLFRLRASRRHWHEDQRPGANVNVASGP